MPSPADVVHVNLKLPLLESKSLVFQCTLSCSKKCTTTQVFFSPVEEEFYNKVYSLAVDLAIAYLNKILTDPSG